jgi:hypothetical protein
MVIVPYWPIRKVFGGEMEIDITKVVSSATSVAMMGDVENSPEVLR